MRLILLAIKKSLYSIVLLFVILTGFIAFLVSSTPGLYLSVKLANRFLPGHLDVIAIQGQAAHHVSLKQLTWSDKNLQLTVHDLDIHWRLRDLFWHNLRIKNIQIGQVDIVLLKNTAETKEKSSIRASGFPKLTVEASIDNMRINKLDIISGNSRTKFQNLQVQVNLSNSQWDIPHLDVSFNKHTIHLQALVETAFPYKANALLQIKNPEKINSGIEGQLTLSGDFQNYQWTGGMKNPTTLSLQGSLKNGSELHSAANWQQLNWSQMLRLEKGHFQIDGTIPDLVMSLTTEQSLPFDARLNATIRTFANKLDAKATIKTRLAPDLPWQNILMNASYDYQQQGLNAEASLGANLIKLTGKLTAPWTFTAIIPDPGLLHPSLLGLKTNITAEGTFNNPQQGNLLLTIKKGRYEIPEKLNLPFEGGVLLASLDSKQLQTTGNFTLDANTSLNLSLQLPGFRSAIDKQKVTGTMRLTVNSLAFLNDASPEINNAKGQLHAELNLAGTIDKPLLTGKLNLHNASLALPKMGINLNPVQLSIQSQDKSWEAKGAVVSNGKTLTIQGRGDFFPLFNGKLSFIGSDIPVLNTSEYVIMVSPKLDLDMAPASYKLSGSILIPKAQIKPQTFTDTVSLSDDVVFVNKQAPPTNPYDLNTDISIEMGNDVALDIKGLHGFLTGGIHLQLLPGRQMTASGELNIRDGKYTAYGQDLIIQQGQLLFTGGDADNPGIRVRAVRQFKNTTNSFAGSNQLFDFKPDNIETLDMGNQTTTGIEVSGRLTEPKIKLFSIPSNLSQADILSLLLLGKPASQANESGGQLLLTAVSAMNLGSGSGGTQLLEQLKQNLGLDFNVQNNAQYDQKTNQSTSQTAFVVGKSLSKRLYLSYNMGLSSTDNNMLTLKYLLNKFLSIQVNASMNASGIDLLYTHQKE